MSEQDTDITVRTTNGSPRQHALEATLEAGKQLLKERGPSIALTNVPLEEAINLAGSPRASVYRAWQGYGDGDSARDNFHEALACYLLEEGLAGGPQAAIVLEQQMAAFVMMYPPEKMAALPVEERRQLLRTAIATLGVLAVATTGSITWHARIAVSAAITCQQEQDVSPRLRDAYMVGEREASQRYLPIYEKFSDHFGMRLKEPYTMAHFAAAVLSLAEGTRAREMYLQEAIEPFDDSWGLFNTSVLGLVREFFEADPEHPSPTQLGD